MRDRAFKLGVINGILFEAIMAIMNPSMVMSAFFLRVTGSTVFASLPSTLMYLGWVWPQLFISNVAESLDRKKPIYVIGGSVRIVSLAVMAGLAFFLDNAPSGWFVLVFPLLYFVYCSGGGIGGVAFMDVVAKTVPTTRRGLFWGVRGFFGGILGICAGFYVRYMLGSSGPAFPSNYALLFATATPILILSIWAFAAVDEPVTTAKRDRTPFRQYLAEGVEIFREDRDYRLLFLVRALMSLTMMGQVVFIPFAIKALSLPESIVGVLMMVATGFALPSNFLWSRIADRRGNRLVMLVAMGIYLLVPPMAIVSYYAPPLPLGIPLLAGWNLRAGVFVLAFILSAIANKGYFLGYMNYLLEISPEDRRPSYQAFMGVLSAPFTLVPLLAGWLAQNVSFQATFASGMLFGAGVYALLLKLREPRNEDASSVMPSQHQAKRSKRAYRWWKR